MRPNLVITLAGLIAALAAQPVAADPIALMSLWESPTADEQADPWPAGVRVVIYDNGQVLKVVRPPTASAPAQVVTGHVSSEGAKVRAARMLAMLSGTPRPEYIKADFPERRTSVLQVWDAAKQYPVKWAVVGHPCAGIDGSEPDGLDRQVRVQLDPRFRDACDLLANTMVPEPADWSPEIIRIYLERAEDAEGRGAAWPIDWLEEARWGSSLFVCMNKQAVTEDFTRKLLSMETRVQKSALELLVNSPDGKTWRVSAVRYALPGAIYHVDRGSDYVNTATIADGPCRHP
jgi:hypothetical protein